MKTKKREFETFAREFRRWQTLLSCNDWDLMFFCQKLDGNHAEIRADAKNSIADVMICSERDEKRDRPFDPAKLAKHEAMHLFLARLSYIASCRFVNDGELNDEEERLVRMLVRLIPDNLSMSDMTKVEDIEK